jgi:CHAT domain-containing protein
MKSILVIAFLVSFYSSAFGTIVSTQKINSSIQQSIVLGYYPKAIHQINTELKKKSNSVEQQIFLYKTKGDIYKSRGDLDECLKYWLISNKLRSKIYKKGDYHLAWNYALISNYHYEKIEIPLTKLYADSCLELIQNLSIEEQKEIEIFKIWNILGQSVKQSYSDLSSDEKLKRYELIREYYFKSEKFIQENSINQIYLAKTYHLIANSYFDNIHEFFKPNNKKGADAYFKNALKYYKKAITIWNKRYGVICHGKAASYYLIGMMYTCFSKEVVPDDHIEANYYFDQSLKAYGIDEKKTNLNYLSSLPTKESVLQCIRYYTQYEIQNININNHKQKIQKVESLTKIAIKIWQFLYLESKSNNTNLLLSTYNLIPYKESIELELLKRKYGEKWSLKTIFNANQFLKYYDLVKFKHEKHFDAVTSIENIQKKLTKNELFLDFISSQYDRNYVIEIRKNKSKIIEINQLTHLYTDSLKSSITEINYQNYIKQASEMYQLIFKNIHLKSINRVIICPDGSINEIPFEALLYSNKNKLSNDYRKLDYLIYHAKIEYMLAPRYFIKPITKINLNGSVFCPSYKNTNFSELPFSEKFALSIEKIAGLKTFVGKKAEKKNLLKIQTPILHISGHGMIDTKNSVFSKIILTNSTLSIGDIYKWKKSPEFVVINSCNSGNGKIRVGDGVDGIIRAFHTSTTSASISNFWEVDDKASNELFTSFYERINEKSSISNSLRKSKIDCIKKAASSILAAPYFWAGYKMIGEIEINEKKSSSENQFYFISGICIIMLFILLFMFKNLLFKRNIF